jgi:hypothetical protein
LKIIYYIGIDLAKSIKHFQQLELKEIKPQRMLLGLCFSLSILVLLRELTAFNGGIKVSIKNNLILRQNSKLFMVQHQKNGNQGLLTPRVSMARELTKN